MLTVQGEKAEKLSNSQVTQLLMSPRGLRTACKHMNKELLIFNIHADNVRNN